MAVAGAVVPRAFRPRARVLTAGVIGVFALSGFMVAAPAASALPPDCSESGTTVSCSYAYQAPGSEQTFAVPAGVSTVQVDATGAPGGGGLGASVSAPVTATPGSTLFVEVGGVLGWNGGGSPGGGGASDVRTVTCGADCSNSASLASRLVVAGGGGGAGTPNGLGGPGGAAGSGGTAGQSVVVSGAGQPGAPGSSSAGGAGGAGGSIFSGSHLDITQAVLGVSGSPGALGVGGGGGISFVSFGGGGGGGYYGGGGGGGGAGVDVFGTGWLIAGGGGGGGGSSYAPGGTIAVSSTRVPSVTISYQLAAPVLTSAAATSFTSGSPGSFSFTTTGVWVPSLSESGTLPPGVSFTDNGDGTATLAGTPGPDTSGSYPVSITASNGLQPDAIQSFTLNVNSPPAISSVQDATFDVGRSGSVSFATTGFPKPALSESGALPSGLNFTDNGDGTATLSGTPARGAGGRYPLTVTASNGMQPAASQSFMLNVQAPPSAFISEPAAGRTYVQHQEVVTSFACSEGVMGPGLAGCLDSDGQVDGAGRLDTTTLGKHIYSVTGVSQDGQTGSASVAYTVAGPPRVSLASPSSGAWFGYGQVVRARYSCRDGSYGPGLSSCTGDVNSGVRIDTSQPGGHTFTVTALSADGVTTTRSVSYTVRPRNTFVQRPHIDSNTDGAFHVGVHVPGPGRIDVMVTAWNDNLASIATLLQPAKHRFVFARAHADAVEGGRIEMLVEPNARGRLLVSHHRYRITLRLWVSYTPRGGRQHNIGYYGVHLPA